MFQKPGATTYDFGAKPAQVGFFYTQEGHSQNNSRNEQKFQQGYV
jgi:hypothetical protein